VRGIKTNNNKQVLQDVVVFDGRCGEIKPYSLCQQGNVVCSPNQLFLSAFHGSEGTDHM
jgi:hypothetical protein